MSYLTVPRVHWAGQFLASPSTINNRESNYRTAPPPQFPAYPTYPPSVPPGAAVLWNPMGVALFQLDGRNVNGTDLPGCTVQSVMPASGALVSSPDADALVGASIQSSNQPSSAKIVDLDPEQQLATQLFGLQIQMVFADGTPGFSMKTGQFVPVPNLTDYAGTGCFETAIAPGQLDWNPAEVSPLYKSFRDACQPCGISVRFLVNDYDGDPGSPTFNFGTIVGALGPARPGEPARCSVGRKFLGSNGAFNAGYLEIDAARSKVVIDFGNAPPRFDYVAGKSPELEAGVTRSGATTPFGGPLDYSAPQYTLTSGILEVDLVEGVEGAPVSILRDGTPVMSEFVAQPGDDLPTGAYVMPTRISQRLSYGEADSDPVELVARRFGQPLAGQSLAISLSSGGSGLTFPPSVTTDADGHAPVPLTATPAPLTGGREWVGSAVYFLVGPWQGTSFNGNWPMGNAFLTVKAYPEYQIPASPTWVADVEPIMQQFMTLYPGMKQMHDLSKYEVARGLAPVLRAVFETPITDPRYMPVTRELDPLKRQMVVQWIDDGTPLGP